MFNKKPIAFFMFLAFALAKIPLVHAAFPGGFGFRVNGAGNIYQLDIKRASSQDYEASMVFDDILAMTFEVGYGAYLLSFGDQFQLGLNAGVYAHYIKLPYQKNPPDTSNDADWHLGNSGFIRGYDKDLNLYTGFRLPDMGLGNQGELSLLVYSGKSYSLSTFRGYAYLTHAEDRNAECAQAVSGSDQTNDVGESVLTSCEGISFEETASYGRSRYGVLLRGQKKDSEVSLGVHFYEPAEIHTGDLDLRFNSSIILRATYGYGF
ncbi:MAG: hypothetical protein RRB13_08875 [bacterium]|nr:hypothetical protein [bacterium]